MTRFIAGLNGGNHINIPADRMVLTDDHTGLLVYQGLELVAYVDMGAVVTAHMSNRAEARDGS